MCLTDSIILIETILLDSRFNDIYIMEKVIREQYDIVKQLIQEKHNYSIRTYDDIIYLYDIITDNITTSSELKTLYVINLLNDMTYLDRSSILSVYKRLYEVLYNNYKTGELELLYRLNTIYNLYFDGKIETSPVNTPIKSTVKPKNVCTERRCTKISKGIYEIYRVIDGQERIYYTAYIRDNGKNVQKMSNDLDIVKDWYNEKSKNKPTKQTKYKYVKKVKVDKPISKTVKQFNPDKVIKIVTRKLKGKSYNYFSARISVNRMLYCKVSSDYDTVLKWLEGFKY